MSPGCRQVQRGAQVSPPAGGVREAHLQRRAWKEAARLALLPGRTLAAARPPESRLPGMAIGRQVVVASLTKATPICPSRLLRPTGRQGHIRAHREFCLHWDPF